MANLSLDEFLACQGMSDAEKARLADALETRDFPAGSLILKQGDLSDHTHFVLNGRVSVRMESNGLENLVAELGPGSIFGEMGMILGDRRSASVFAEDDCHIGLLSKARFMSWLEEGDGCALKLLLNVVHVQAVRLRQVNTKLIELSEQHKDNEVRADLQAFRQKLFGEWSL